MKRPFLGWGLGTFPVVYPQFRSFYTTFFVNQAHNDYLQLLVETGLAGVSIAVWFLVLVFRRALDQTGELDRECNRRPYRRGAARVRGHPGAQPLRFQSANPGQCCSFLCSLRHCGVPAFAGIPTPTRSSPPQSSRGTIPRNRHAGSLEPLISSVLSSSSVPCPRRSLVPFSWTSLLWKAEWLAIPHLDRR